VVAADPDAGSAGAYGVIRALVREVQAKLPDLAVATLRPHAPALVRIVPEVGTGQPGVGPEVPVADPREAHAHVQGAFVEWLLDLSRHVPLVVVVDDLHRADEASLAMLASLAHAVHGRRVLLVAALDAESRRGPFHAVRALRDVAWRLDLETLSPVDVKALVRALFGPARHGELLAEWLSSVAGGHPLHCVELARDLVERRVIRYTDGMWLLPEALPVADRPRALSEAITRRLERLSAPARALAEILAVHGGDLAVERCVLLAEGGDPDEVFAALDELVRADVLVRSMQVYRFRHSGVRGAVLAGVAATRRRLLHRRVAEVLTRTGVRPDNELDVGWHFLHGGVESQAAPLLQRAGMRLYEFNAFADAIAPLEASLRIRTRRNASPRALLELKFALTVCGYMADRAVAARYADDVIAEAGRCCGMDVADAVPPVLSRPWTVAPVLAVAFGARTVARALHPDRAEQMDPAEALRLYVMSVIYACALAASEMDLDRMAQLVARLEPLSSMPSARIRGAHGVTQLFHRFFAGEHADIPVLAEGIVRPLRRGPSGSLDRKLFQGAALTMAALVHAPDGDSRCLELLEELEGLELQIFRVGALQVRAYYHLCRGEAHLAEEAHAEHERLSLRLGNAWQMRVWRAATEAVACGPTGDVLGLKRSIEDLSTLVSTEGFGRFEANLWLARGEYHRERGELGQAREAIERALRLLSEGPSVYREVALAAYAETLLALGDRPGAARTAHQCIEASCVRNRVHARLRCERVLALCEAQEGQVDAAVRRADRTIREAERIGNPAFCGQAHETRARVAQLAGDGLRFQVHAHEAGRWFRSTANAVLIARHERLAKPPAASAGPPEPVSEPVSTVADNVMVWARAFIHRSSDPVVRLRRGLEVAVRCSGAVSGVLGWRRAARVELLGVPGGDAVATDVGRALARVLEGGPPVAASPCRDPHGHWRIFPAPEAAQMPFAVGLRWAEDGSASSPSPELLQLLAHLVGEVREGVPLQS
jgi:tetratricopeptide (TPR) repeat protein